MPMGPFGIFLLAKVLANVPNQPALKLNTPKQLGPSILIPLSDAILAICCCASRPAVPVSAKPDVNTTALLTPLSAHSFITCNATFSGTEITALSTGTGTEEIFG